MFIPAAARVRRRALPHFLAACFFLMLAVACPAASIRGVVTDGSGAKVTGASIILFTNGKAIATTASTADGSFQINTGVEGRFFLVVSAKTFRQLETPTFYAARMDAVERNIVLEPEWVRESIVVTPTGVPTPQPQTSESTTVLGPLDLQQRTDLVGALRTVPGTVAVQSGQPGSTTSLFVRGGNSDANEVLLDGVSVDNMGGEFDFGLLSATAIEKAEVYRGTDSNLYGANAGSSVISLTTPRGTTSFPSFFLQGDAGNFHTSHEEAELAGARKQLDYLGAYSWFQTSNALPNDEYHVGTGAANIGYQLTSSTQLRGTVHYGVDGSGVPSSWDFYHLADSATQNDQNLFISAAIDNQTTPAFHNKLLYGGTRKREQYNQWAQVGSGEFDAYGDTLGDLVTIVGANGYSVTGRAILDFAGIYPSGFQEVNNRDQLVYQGDYRFTPHLTALIGFRFEQERGLYVDPAYNTDQQASRTNYNYLAGVHGDFRQRFFYTLGGSLQRYSLFGTQTSPRAGLSLYAFKPRSGAFSGTRIVFNYGDGVREPKLSEQIGSLYQFLDTPTLLPVARQLNIGPLAAPGTRTYEGGLEQTFFSSHLVLRANYFHNQFGREIESVGAEYLVNDVLTNLSPSQKQSLIAALGSYYHYDSGLYVNTEAFRAQGFETTLESGIGRSLFFRGGYTYVDSVVQRSFSGDNEALAGGYAYTYSGIPVGQYSPLVGARPFRRPPHSGFVTGAYTTGKYTAILTGAFSSRSDDSTYLLDANYGGSMLLPNRDLDYGFAKIDLGGSYNLLDWLSIYGDAENLLSQQHIAPIGYPSLPMSFRTGLRLALGKASH